MEVHIPPKGALSRTAVVTINAAPETVFQYISGSEQLADWLKKSGPINGAVKVVVVKGPYSKIGAVRTVYFDDGSSINEELAEYDPFRYYSYSVSGITNKLSRFTKLAYGQCWFREVSGGTETKWTYSFVPKNFISRLILSVFLSAFYKKFMVKALAMAKLRIEGPNKKLTAFQKPGPPSIGKEYVSDGEEAIISEMVKELEDELTRVYKFKEIPRQIHTKMHGCVQATFTVEEDLPLILRAGIFQESKSYPAWIRFSNSNSTPQRDSKKDMRGFAIKLLDVPGEKLLNDQKTAGTQDFLLMSTETFFAKNLRQFRKLMRAVATGNKAGIAGFFLNPEHWGLLGRLIKSNTRCEHVFDIPYWSTQPYQFGDQSNAVKYHVRPVADNRLQFGDMKAENYLRDNMVRTLAAGSVAFEFCVQFQTNAVKMPIEDPTVAWTSPMLRVARINIPVQHFDTPEQNELGEQFSFSPWHSLPAHRPLGSFNRARRRVYEALSKFRHHKNKKPFSEPQIAPHKLAR